MKIVTESTAPTNQPHEHAEAETTIQNDRRWRWAGYGCFFGLFMVASDTFLEWRGPSPLMPWTGDGVTYNIGYLSSAILMPAAIGLALGYWRDNRRLKRMKS